MPIDLKGTAKSPGVFSEIAFYLRREKKYWLVPMIAILLLFSALLVFSQAAPAVSPFIYTLF